MDASLNNSAAATVEPSANSNMYDVVISGGGLTGCLAALSLCECKKSNGDALKIAIVENHSHATTANTLQSNFDDRVLALSHSTVAYLKKLELWNFGQGSTPIETIHISDQGHYGKARVYAKEHQVSALGHVIEMSVLGAGLIKALTKKSNVTWFNPDSISHINWEANQVDITLDSGDQLSAQLLLGCDGANSACRRFANIASQSTPYAQSALITNITPEFPHENIAYERFTDSGPIAVLPLSSIEGKPRCSVVWTLTPEMEQAMKTQSEKTLKPLLEQSFGHWLGKIKHMGKCDIYQLNLVQAEQQVHHRMVLLGNASHTIHPIAGQGFNLGVRDVEQLTASIKQLLGEAKLVTTETNDADLGSLGYLMAYAEARQRDHRTIITLTDSLVTLFSNKHFPLVMSRNIGLKALNYITPFKDAFVKKTMGY